MRTIKGAAREYFVFQHCAGFGTRKLLSASLQTRIYAMHVI